MYLEDILGTTTKVRIIGILLQQAPRELSESELARESKVSVSEVHRQAPPLVQAGLLTLHRA